MRSRGSATTSEINNDPTRGGGADDRSSSSPSRTTAPSNNSHSPQHYSLKDDWMKETDHRPVPVSAGVHRGTTTTAELDYMTKDRLAYATATNSYTEKAVPGRPRRRRKIRMPPPGFLKRNRKGRQSKLSSSFLCCCRNKAKALGQSSKLLLAVMLWYSLGVVSIATSKLLLTPAKVPENHPDYYLHVGGVPPLFLTVQQLFLGSSLLRFLLSIRFLKSPGLHPWSMIVAEESSSGNGHHSARHGKSHGTSSPSVISAVTQSLSHPSARYLVGSGIFFTLGFFLTNVGFRGTSASFVETIKAAEPLTSAGLAVWAKLEVLSSSEVLALLCIVAGVVLSTMGNSGSSTAATASVSSSSTMIMASMISCGIVLLSNLCFSLRGLSQKFYRAQTTTTTPLDDLNLQFRMQQLGMILLLVPMLIWNGPGIAGHVYMVATSHNVGLWQSGVLLRYFGLSLANGFAFTSYNLASTYILSRISVVHHAALNCIRRIFAIVVTSIVFVIPITFIGGCGILVSVVGFLSFSVLKARRNGGEANKKPLSSLLPHKNSDLLVMDHPQNGRG